MGIGVGEIAVSVGEAIVPLAVGDTVGDAVGDTIVVAGSVDGGTVVPVTVVGMSVEVAAGVTPPVDVGSIVGDGDIVAVEGLVAGGVGVTMVLVDVGAGGLGVAVPGVLGTRVGEGTSGPSPEFDGSAGISVDPPVPSPSARDDCASAIDAESETEHSVSSMADTAMQM